jgi:hypothetical protein
MKPEYHSLNAQRKSKSADFADYTEKTELAGGCLVPVPGVGVSF